MGNSIGTDHRWPRHDSLAPQACLQNKFAYTKWLGHPVVPPVYVLMKRLPEGGAPRIPTIH